MKTFLDIAHNGVLNLLVISGNPKPEELVLAWEEIIRENSRVNGSFEFQTYTQLLKSYGLLIAEYTIVKSMLLKLAFVIDYGYVKELRKRGYQINLVDTIGYSNSVAAAYRKVDNLITRATMQKKEIERNFSGVKKEQGQTFEEIMAGLNVSLGFTVPDDITLARFNEYKKIIHQRNKVTNV